MTTVNITTTDNQLTITDGSGTATVTVPATTVVTATTAGPKGDQGGDNIPQNAQSGTYTLVASDAGKHIQADANVTVPNNVFSVGDVIRVYNNKSGTIELLQSNTTLKTQGVNDGDKTLAEKAFVTLVCIGTNTFAAYGNGITAS